MSHTITLDTLEYANQLKSVGVPDIQAEKFARLQKKRTDEICAFIDDSLTTKHDIELVKVDLSKVEFALKSDMALIKKYIAWIMIVGVILGAIILAGSTILGILITFHK